jgi:hypothetical protein
VFCSSFPTGEGDDVQDDFIGVPMFFGGIGQAATEIALFETGFILELAERREEIEGDGSSAAFAWMVARKPRR